MTRPTAVSDAADLNRRGEEPSHAPPHPGDRVMVTWPNGRRYGTVSPSGSYLGRRDVCRGHATVRVIELHSQPICDMAIEMNVSTSTELDA